MMNTTTFGRGGDWADGAIRASARSAQLSQHLVTVTCDADYDRDRVFSQALGHFYTVVCTKTGQRARNFSSIVTESDLHRAAKYPHVRRRGPDLRLQRELWSSSAP